MTIRVIRERARELKVKNYGKMNKEQLIRAIQSAEGNADCFGKIPDCGQADCCWREDCLV